MTEPAGKEQIFIRKLSEMVAANMGNENFGVKEMAHESGLSYYPML